MRYSYVNPEVIATQVTKEMLSSLEEDALPKLGAKIPKVGDFLVQFADKTTELMDKEKFYKLFKPTLSMSEHKKEMYKLCTEIIEQEELVDEDNAETLLAHAVDCAKNLRKLINK